MSKDDKRSIIKNACVATVSMISGLFSLFIAFQNLKALPYLYQGLSVICGFSMLGIAVSCKNIKEEICSRNSKPEIIKSEKKLKPSIEKTLTPQLKNKNEKDNERPLYRDYIDIWKSSSHEEKVSSVREYLNKNEPNDVSLLIETKTIKKKK